MLMVYKYEIPEREHCFKLSMPANAKILTVQVQFEKPYIWALVDTEGKNRDRHFRLIGTGHNHNFELDPYKIEQYVGTYQIDGGASVFHLFEVRK